MTDKTELYNYIQGFTMAFEDASDGAWMAVHENAVESFNQANGTDYDWFAEAVDYIDWLNGA